jgi:hypothetical protein
VKDEWDKNHQKVVLATFVFFTFLPVSQRRHITWLAGIVFRLVVNARHLINKPG